MKKLLVGCFLMASYVCSSQNFKYEIVDQANYSPAEQISPTKDGFLYFEADVNKKVTFGGLNLHKLRMGVKINKLDTSLKLIATKDFLNGEKKLLPGLFNFIKFNNKHCIVYQDVKNEDLLGSLKLAVIDETTLDVNSETTLLDLDKYKIGYETKSVVKYNISTYETQVSRSGKMLLSVTQPQTEKGERKQIFLTVFDENLKMVMDRKIVFKEDMVRISSYVCDDSGNVFIGYVWWYEDEKSKKGTVLEEVFKVMIVKPQNAANQILPVQLPGYSLAKLQLVHSPVQNKVYLMGILNKAWDDHFSGMYHTSIDLTSMKMEKLTGTDFTSDLVKKFDDDGYASTKEKNYGLSRNFESSTAVRGDGTVDLILEYQKVKPPTMDSRGKMGSITDYYAGNFLDAHVVNNKIIFSRIPRDMLSPGSSAYLNHTTFSKDGNLTFLYNENENNIENSIDEKARFAVVQKSEICATTISSDGKLKRELLLKGYNAKTIGLLNRVYRIAPNSFFILLQKLNFSSMSTADTKYARVTVD